ncbi:hypothetical protein [Haliscomenobacter sp.]|uniref:hypothetical protein n=1 Tax=Haliscomenobacter sp. TaxID=2717303 RepID=UPI0035945480
MQTFKLFQILTHFDKLEQNRIRKFISSPYFNKDKVVLALFELMAEEINDPTNKVWTKEKIWDTLVPELPYDDARLRKYQSDLLKLIEQYLIQQEFESDTLAAQTYLLRSIKKKKLKKLHNSTLKTVKDIPNKTPYRDGNYFLGQFLIETAYDDLSSDFEEKKTDKTNHEHISKLLDFFYIGEKLKIYCEVLSRKKVAKHEYEISLIEKVINFAELDDYQSIPFVSIYYQILKMYVDPQELNHYYKFLELLKDSSHFFPKNQEKSFYDSAQNYCVAQINQGNSEFLKELFSVYKTLIDKNFFEHQGSLESWEFRNIVVVGLRSGEYEWTEKFINTYINILPKEIRENVLSFNLSQLYLYQKKYPKVISILQEVEYNDYITNLAAKSTLIGAYYEVGELDPLSSLLESFRVYLNRNNEIPIPRKILYKNLIKFTKKLISLPPSDNKKLLVLKQEVESTKNIASRDWLLEKIAELV